MSPADEGIYVLHVDDDADFADLVATFLSEVSERIEVETRTEPERGLDRLSTEPVDCVVTDLDMPGIDGIELLRAVRADRPALPVILYTGKGSEEIASEAIAAGVTDYLQKGGGRETFAVLANRIENAVDGYRAHREHERAERRFRKLIEETVDVVAVFGPDGIFKYHSPAAESLVGYGPDELVGEDVFDHVHPDDRERVWNRFVRLFSGDEERTSVRCQFRAKDGTRVDLDVRGRNLVEDPDVEGVLVYGQDATRQVQHDRELERYERMANESGDMIYTTDADGRLTAVNDTAVSFLGHSREALIGGPISTIITDESAARGRRAAEFLREADDPDGMTVEQEFVTAEGEIVPSEAHLTLLYDSNGAYQGTVGVVRDISTRKDRERTLRALHAATHELVAAETREEIIEVIVDTAQEVLALPLVGLWLYDEEERALVPTIYPEDPALPAVPPIYREGSGLSWDAFVAGESRSFSDLRTEEA